MTKSEWRALLLAARRRRPGVQRAQAGEQISAHLLAEAAGLTGRVRQLTVCGYLPLPSEPLADDLPDRLAAAGVRVLLPIAAAGRPLDWSLHGGPVRSGSLGIREPAGPRLGPLALLDADAVLVPALAVDRIGHRLGRGGGHYDRSLALLRPGRDRPRLIAVLFDGEIVDDLPHDRHDIAVTEVVTPDRGLLALPLR